MGWEDSAVGWEPSVVGWEDSEHQLFFPFCCCFLFSPRKKWLGGFSNGLAGFSSVWGSFSSGLGGPRTFFIFFVFLIPFLFRLGWEDSVVGMETPFV